MIHKKYPIETKSIDELIKEAMELLAQGKEMTREEEIEDDAEGGYFVDD